MLGCFFFWFGFWVCVYCLFVGLLFFIAMLAFNHLAVTTWVITQQQATIFRYTVD